MQTVVRMLLIAILTFMLTTSLAAVPLQDLRQERGHPQNLDKVNACLYELNPSFRGRKATIYNSGLEFIADNDFYVIYLIGINEPEWMEKYFIVPDKGEILEFDGYDPWVDPILRSEDLVNRIAKIPRRARADRFQTVTVTLDRNEKCIKYFQPNMMRQPFALTIAKLNLEYMEKEAKITRKQRLDMAQQYLQKMARINEKIPEINLEYFTKHPQLLHEFFNDEIAYITQTQAYILRELGLTIPKRVLELPDNYYNYYEN